jgi:hypothetical protein
MKGRECNILSALLFLRFVAAAVCLTLPLVGGHFRFAGGAELGYKTIDSDRVQCVIPARTG